MTRLLSSWTKKQEKVNKKWTTPLYAVGLAGRQNLSDSPEQNPMMMMIIMMMMTLMTMTMTMMIMMKMVVVMSVVVVVMLMMMFQC